MIKNFYKAYILLFFLFVGCSGDNADQIIAQTFVEQHGQLSVKGTSLVDKDGKTIAPVSYTHLDVYKRQLCDNIVFVIFYYHKYICITLRSNMRIKQI